MADPTVATGLDRRQFLASSATLAAAAVAGSIAPIAAARPAAAQGRRRQPNIVFVVADDLGYGELGSFGQRLIQTPNLDRLAGEGVRFSQFYAGGAVCAPSRCTLLTGLHTGHCSVRTNPLEGPASAEALTPDEVTFGHVMQAAGYRTGLFGKWGFGPEEPGHHSHPGPKGFEEFFGYVTHNHAHDYYPDYLWENDQPVSVPANADGAQGAFAPDLFAQRALDFVERHRDDPFLLVLSTNVPHSPQVVPDLGQYSDEPWRDAEKAHAAQITRMDADVGRILATLERLGLAQDTLVFFTSDNGPHDAGNPRLDPLFFDAAGPLRGIKRNVYEGGIRVPMIVWGPGQLRATPGTVSDHVWSTWDVFATFADIAGAPVPPDLDGRSMRRAFMPVDEAAPPQHHYLYWYRREPFVTPLSNAADRGRGRQVCEAVRRGDWKAVRFAPGVDRSVPDEEWDVELYNLARDPGERDNVAGTYPQIATSLVALMHDAWSDPPYHREVWSPNGLAIALPPVMGWGDTERLTVRFTNHGREAIQRLRLDLEVPAGWNAMAVSGTSFATLAPGHVADAGWEVTSPATPDAERSEPVLHAHASWQLAEHTERARLSATPRMEPLPVLADSYLSDLEWISAVNGHGPVERDTSNGADQAGDGTPISIRGNTYDKGLGVHAYSEIRYWLGGTCSRFTADVGIDDFSADRQDYGSVTFEVWGDATLLYDSGLVVSTDPPLPVEVAVDGVDELTLIVTDGGNGKRGDNAVWAGAHVTYGGRR